MSTIIASNVSDGTLSIPTTYVTNGSAKAWAEVNMATATIKDSLNVASITDTATGDFTVTQTSAMGSLNYGIVTSGGDRIDQSVITSASAHRQISEGSTFARTDPSHFTSAVFGDLA